MELRRIYLNRRLSTLILKYILVIGFILFGFSMFVRGPKKDILDDVNILQPVEEAETEEIVVPKQFIAQYYEDAGLPYDNYCQKETRIRVSRVQKICQLYFQEAQSLLQTTTSMTVDKLATHKIQFKAFMSKLKKNEPTENKVRELMELMEMPELDHVELDAPRKMFLCVPHKVGSQTWRHFFETLKIRDGINETEIFRKKTSFPDGVSGFNKVFQVRHPFERILSAYRFIFEREAMRTNIQELKQEIIDAFPFLPSEMDEAYYYLNTSFPIKKGSFDVIPNFRQFAEHVIRSGPDFGIERFPVVSHWLPYYFSCSPCHEDFNPNMVIRMETILKDTLCYLDSVPEIDWDDVSKLHHVNQSPHGHSSNRDLQKNHFQKLSRETMQGLYERYKPDFLLYGYTLDDFLPLATL